jgi:hypothetical protein
MTELEELIAMADAVCQRLDKMSMNEKNFCVDMCIQLEIWAWETCRMVRTLQDARNEIGG